MSTIVEGPDYSAQQAQAFEYQEQPPLQRNASNQVTSSKSLNFLFGVIFCTNLMINVDHGILPACTQEVKDDIKLDNASLGLLGSLVYAGLVAVFNYCNTKFVLIVCLLCTCASLILFTVSNYYYLLVISRVAVGFFQVFFCIYFPVWVDLFADEKRKTVWLTLLLLGVPLGIILGYISTAFLVVYLHWKWTFYIQAVLLIPLLLCFMFTPARFIVYTTKREYQDTTQNDISKMTESLRYYNLSNFESSRHYPNEIPSSYHRRDSSNIIMPIPSQQSMQRDPEGSPTFALNQTNVDENSFAQDRSRVESKYGNIFPNKEHKDFLNVSGLQAQLIKNKSLDSQRRQEQGYENRSIKKTETRIQQERRMRANSTVTMKYRKKKEREMRKLTKIVENYTLKQKIFFLLTNFNFMMLLLGITGVYFITTGIQFWVTDYFVTVLGATKNEAFTTFSICSLTGPIFGVITGGYVFNHLGGYNSPVAYPLAVFVMFCAGVCGFPIAFVDDFYLSAILLWGQFFFGGCGIPVLTGILLNTCPPPVRTIANSIANLVYNLLGYLPSPYIYGLVYQLNGGGKSKSGMFALQLSGLISCGLMFLLLLKKQALEKEEKSQHQKKLIQSQGGAALDLIDNDQIGPLLSQMSDESMLRKRKEIPSFSSNDDSDVEYGAERFSFKTPVSDRIKIESTSVLYSKSVYPLSLGIHDED